MGNVLKLVEENAKLSDWELFWECYPRKKAKLDAIKAWKQTENIRPPIEALLAAIDTQSKSDDWTRDGGQYVPYPAKWLRQGYWEDE